MSGYIAVSSRVIARNSMGQFIAACKEGATGTVEEAIHEGAEMSRALAPMKTGELKGSISAEMTGATSGVWKAETDYAMAQEEGASPHEITGWVRFFWENEGRLWQPGDNTIHHPGNPGRHYLATAYAAIMGRIMAIARRNYPG